MRSFRGFTFSKKKKQNADQDDYKYSKYTSNTREVRTKNSKYFSDQEIGRKKRRMVVNLLLSMTLTDDVSLSLLYDVSHGFDLPLVIGEQFICKLHGKTFQSASYNDCLQFILTTLHLEGFQFAINIYSTLMDKLDANKKCLLAYHGFSVKTRKYHFSEYKNCFVGKEAVTWMVTNCLCKTRQNAVALAQYWMAQKLIKHVTDEQKFEDNKHFYQFVCHNNNNDNIDNIADKKAATPQQQQQQKQQLTNITSDYSDYNGHGVLSLKETPSYSSRFNPNSPRSRQKQVSSFTLPTILGS